MKLSVIMPVYNEKNNILKILDKVKAVKLDKEIVIVDDFSSDGTRDILKSIKQRRIKIFYHHKNYGKGMAIRTALKHITGDIVIIQDGDLEYDPQEYVKLVKPITNGETKVVYGSRLIFGNKSYTNLHYIATVILNSIVRILYTQKITDVPTCYKVFDAKLIKSIPLKCTRFAFDFEITAKVCKRGHKIKEIPISYYPRSIKEGKKIKWQDGVEAAWTLIKYRLME